MRSRLPRDGRPKFRAFITKYALTKGIFEIEGEQSLEGSPSFLSDLNNHFGTYHGEGKQWHRTQEEALARAEEMRKDKIASIEKQRKKLETMTFSIAPFDGTRTPEDLENLTEDEDIEGDDR